MVAPAAMPRLPMEARLARAGAALPSGRERYRRGCAPENRPDAARHRACADGTKMVAVRFFDRLTFGRA